MSRILPRQILKCASRLLSRLHHDRRGAAAMLVAFSVPALVGVGAMAIDVSMYRYVDNRLQSAADAGALAGLSKIDTPATAITDGVNFAQRNVPSNFGNVTIASDVQVGTYNGDTKIFVAGLGPDVNAVRVTATRSRARSNGVPRILSVFWGSDAANVSATAIAARSLRVQYEPPERTNLDNEAYDFNELYVYCYKYGGTGTAASRRSQMTLMSNNVPANQKITTIIANAGGNATTLGIKEPPTGNNLVWPECAKDESLSFRLHNVRDAKNNPALFKTPKNLQIFDHYTDTHIVSGVEQFELNNNILETVRCDTFDKCDPSKAGSQVPKGKNRTPKVEKTPCLPGKYMYFGWEDRPPAGAGGSDKDYDDIVTVMKCPTNGILGDGMSRLVA